MKQPSWFSRNILRYPSVVISLVFITILVGISVYAMISIPYEQAKVLWRGGEDIWYANPRQAAPEWFNWFSKQKKPVSFSLKSTESDQVTTITNTDEKGNQEIILTYDFDYPYDTFPQEIIIYFNAVYAKKQPFAEAVWVNPDGKQTRLTNLVLTGRDSYRISADEKLKRFLQGVEPMQGLFLDPNQAEPAPLKGHYQLIITAYTFEKDTTFNAELVLHGTLAGWAGTDHLRRDLGIALLWGTPIALAFGLLAALGTTMITISIAAIGAWYRGWLEELIQRITEINLVLPFLPILLMIGTFYSRSIWIILSASILLNIFGAGIKTYRAVFMQIMESPYIEAARSYGATDLRIIFKYMVPRVIPTLVPQIVSLIPAYVFVEATLAVLGLGDPILPTWGKVIDDAFSNSAHYEGLYYWILEPSLMLMFTGLAFSLLGFALDRVFNPRLREM